jgi:hypothetical protein
MAGTLVFVHGTGVRQAGYAATLGAIDQGVRARVPGVRVVGADWGDKFGVPEDVGPALPPEMQARSVTGGLALTDADQAAAKWALLTDDPLFELRLIGGLGSAQSVSFGLLPEQIVVDRLDQLRQAPPTAANSGLSDEELASAIGWVRDTPELVAAVQAVGTADDAELADMIASAIVARLLAEHRFDEPGTGPAIALNGAARDALVTRLGQAIAPDGTRGWVKDRLRNEMTGFVERRATAAVAGRRAGLMGASIPAIGDILYYQRRGEQVRQFVADTLSQAEPPVVAVGHSLGGIILVDLLSGPRPMSSMRGATGSRSSTWSGAGTGLVISTRRCWRWPPPGLSPRYPAISPRYPAISPIGPWSRSQRQRSRVMCPYCAGVSTWP